MNNFYSCPIKIKKYKTNQFNDINFKCSNCLSTQLINGNYLYVGYCNNKIHNNELYTYISQCIEIIDHIDEISFICNNKNCQKISTNTLNGKTKFNFAILSKKENDILELLKEQKQENLKNLLKEYFYALILKHNSSATLLARKMLMNFANIIGCTDERKNFIFYVDLIKNDGILGKKWNPKLDLIRKLGNDETHNLKIANEKELNTIKIVMEQLINCYFLPDLN
ncbi:hypothetical protein [Spiroplasma endosymbiont of Polydrusus pterygomalis]|uniref:hypothetical protein n=1 Tax=Spiroplasma endosymbiont of Polydrusus pterygomalis TaxID=3139327 RepID=UPI003CCAA9B3